MATTQAQQPQTAQTITAESDFNPRYSVPKGEAAPDEQFEFDQSLKDIIGEIEDEFTPAPPDESPESAETAEGTVPTEDEPSEGQEPAESEPAPEQEDPAVIKGIERIVQRETALQAREAAFQAREAQITSRAAQLERENAELKSRLPDQSVVELMNTDPHAAFKAMGHDPETIVKLSIAQSLKAQGKPVPEALARDLEKAEQNRKVSLLEKRLAEKEHAERVTAYFNNVAMGAREYVKSEVGKSKELPTLAHVAKSDPDRVHSEILEEITNDARARMSQDPNGEPMTYEQAARKVEARWSALKALMVQTNAPNATQAPVKPKTPPQQKPPAKPLKPWEKAGTDLTDQGINEAIREFHKLEAARKAKR